MKVPQVQIDLLVEWAINIYGSIPRYLEHNRLQLDDYDLFLKQMKEIHYNNYHGHFSDDISVWFNHYADGKIHFKIYPTEQLEHNIITYQCFSKNVWNYLKDIKIVKGYEQLTLF